MWGADGSGDESEPFLRDFFGDEEEVDGPPSPCVAEPSVSAKKSCQQSDATASDAKQSELDAQLLDAVRNGEVTLVESLVRRGGSLRSREAGVPISAGQPLLHTAVRGRHLHCLQLLLETVEDVNATDGGGETALFTAVSMGWVDGVRALLNARADIKERDKGRKKTVLQVAVNTENAIVTRLIVDAARRYEEGEYEQIINVLNEDGMSPLFVAVIKGNRKIVEILLSARADITLIDKKNRNVAHMVGRKAEEILKIISESHQEDMKRLVGQRCDHRFQTTPLHSAVARGDVSTVQYLIDKFPDSLNDVAYVDGKGDKVVSANILHLVSSSDKAAVLSYFVSILGKKLPAFHSFINGKTDEGKTPLHFALLRRQVEYADALIRAGADLAAEFEEKNGKRSAIDIFIHQVPASVERLTNIFDESIQKARGRATIEVDYEVLWTGGGSNNSFNVLDALQQSGNKLGQEILFEHPLVESFLHLHWKMLQGPYTVLVVLNTLFSFALSLLILFNLLSFELPAKIVMWPMIIFGVPLIIHELECILKKQPLKYRAEFVMKCVCFTLAIFILVPDIPLEFSAFAVLLSWFEVLLLISRIPNTGFYMLLFIEVAIKYLKLLSSFFFIIFGFIIAFMAISKLSSPFDRFIPATMKTMAMMSGEYEFQNLVTALRIPNGNLSPGSEMAAMAVYTLFLVFIGLVLSNLFLAVAVIDVSKVRVISKRTEFLGVYSTFLFSPLCCLYPCSVMTLLFRFVCAVVRPFNSTLVEQWESFREIDRKFEVGVLLTKTRVKFPRELNTAIIARGYKNREALTKKYQEDEEALKRKRIVEIAAMERESDRKQLLTVMKEFEDRMRKEIRLEITGLKQSIFEMLKSSTCPLDEN